MRLRLERHHAGIAEVVLAAPQRHNAIDPAWVEQLHAAVEGIAASDRVVLLRAEGPSFCVGGDIRVFEGDDLGATIGALAEALHAGLLALRSVPVPLVTAVQGAAAGAGMSLALLGDVVLLAEDAQLTPAYGRLGLSPDGGMTWTLPRRVGDAIAADVLLTGRRIDAAEAARVGLASRVLPRDGFEDAARAVAGEIAAAAPTAVAATLGLLRASARVGFEHQLEAEAVAIARQAAGPDGAEGIAAFRERRAPGFPSLRGGG